MPPTVGSSDWVGICSSGDKSFWRAEDWAWDPQRLQALPMASDQGQLLSASGTNTAGAWAGDADDAPCAGGDEAREAANAGDGPACEAGAGVSGGGGAGATAAWPASQDTPKPKNICQADGCSRDLSKLTFYHQRNKICEVHTKAEAFQRNGEALRFCQRCGRPHPLADFDPGKHSCRAELEKHNARRRKAKAEAAAAKKRKKGGARRRRKGSPASSAETSDDEWRGPAAGGPSGERAGGVVPRRRATAARRAAVAATAASSSDEEAATEAVDEGAAGQQGAGPPELQPLDFDVPPLDVLEGVAGDDNTGIDLADDISAWLSRHLTDGPRPATAIAPTAPASQPAIGLQTGWLQQQLSPAPPEAQLHGGVPWQAVQPPKTSFDMAALLVQPAGGGNAHAVGVPAAAAGWPQTVLGAPVAVPQLPRGAGPLRPRPVLSTVSIKLFGCEPSELPPCLRDQMAAMFNPATLASLEGYLRPGCLHLIVQALVDPAAGEAPAEQGAGGAGGEAVAAQPAGPAAAIQPAATSSAAAAQLGRSGTASKSCCGGRAASAATATPSCCASALPQAEAAPAAKWERPASCCGSARPAAASPAANNDASDGGERVRHLVSCMLESGEPLWRSKIMLVQANGHVGLVHHSRLRQTWSIDSAPSDRAVPAIVSTNPMVLLASRPAPMVVAGINLLQDDTELLCRLQGQYVTPVEAGCADCPCRASRAATSAAASSAGVEPELSTSWETKCCGCCRSRLAPAGVPAGAAPLQAVRLRLRGSLPQGLLHLDIQKGAYVATRGAQVLVVGSAVVEAELSRLAASSPATLAPWIAELGILAEWLGAPGKVHWSTVERAAARVLFWAVGSGLPATATLALLVLQQSNAGAAASPAQPAAGCDGLALLGSVASGVAQQAERIAAALDHATELAGTDGLSVLHRAVQSGSAPMLKVVLGWGGDAERPWCCDMAGPFGVTPLHLAAALPDVALSAQLADLLMERCAPGKAAWRAARTADGLTPSDFARLAGNGQPGGATAPAAPKRAAGRGGQGTLPSGAKGLGRQLPPRKLAAVAAQQPADRRTPEEDWRPATPRRCMCAGDCPCSRRGSGKSCCADDDASLDGGCCGTGDGKCVCCNGGEGGGSPRAALPTAGGCCGGAH